MCFLGFAVGVGAGVGVEEQEEEKEEEEEEEEEEEVERGLGRSAAMPWRVHCRAMGARALVDATQNSEHRAMHRRTPGGRCHRGRGGGEPGLLGGAALLSISKEANAFAWQDAVAV